MAFHVTLLLDRRYVSQLLGHPVEQFSSQLGVRDLSPSKTNTDLDFGPLLKEPARVAHFIGDVVLADFRAQANFFDLGLLLRLAGFSFFLGPLVEEFAVIHQAANRGVGVRGYLYQVGPPFAGNLEGFGYTYYTDLPAFFVNQADFSCPDFLIYALVFTANCALSFCIRFRLS